MLMFFSLFLKQLAFFTSTKVEAFEELTWVRVVWFVNIKLSMHDVTFVRTDESVCFSVDFSIV